MKIYRNHKIMTDQNKGINEFYIVEGKKIICVFSDGDSEEWGMMTSRTSYGEESNKLTFLLVVGETPETIWNRWKTIWDS